MVIGQRQHAGLQFNAPRSLRRGRNEQLRTRRNLLSPGMMLADPGFVVIELVEPLHEFQVMFEGQDRILVRRRMRWNECSDSKP